MQIKKTFLVLIILVLAFSMVSTAAVASDGSSSFWDWLVGLFSGGPTGAATGGGDVGAMGDVTGSADWFVTSGPCQVSSTGLVTVPEGCADTTCTVEATYASLSDIAIVNVVNDENTFTSISSSISNIGEDQTQAYTLTGFFPDGCAEDFTAISTLSGAYCTGGAGSINTANVCGNDDPSDCTITAGGFSDTIAVNDDGDVITGITSCPHSCPAGGSVALSCEYTWSDGQTCNDANNICFNDAVVSGAYCSKSGTNLVCDVGAQQCIIFASGQTCIVTVT